jgi:uncharacterized membrane protein YfcA
MMTDILAFGSGGGGGFILGPIGGGSVLAVPVPVYVVGVAQPHIAIVPAVSFLYKTCHLAASARSNRLPCARFS